MDFKGREEAAIKPIPFLTNLGGLELVKWSLQLHIHKTCQNCLWPEGTSSYAQHDIHVFRIFFYAYSEYT